jgi:hypothetical protein
MQPKPAIVAAAADATTKQMQQIKPAITAAAADATTKADRLKANAANDAVQSRFSWIKP